MDRILLIVSIAAAVVYLITSPWQPFPGDAALKGMAVSPLALLALQRLTGKRAWLLAVPLALSAVGDVLLALGNRFFLLGLAAFLVAHLVYINLFRSMWPKPVLLTPRMLIGLVGLFGWSIALTVILLPKLDFSTGPAIPMYVGALTAMAACAFPVATGNNWIVGGAILFVISDSLLGVNRFHTKLPNIGYVVWITYYLAQFCIFTGVAGFGVVRTGSSPSKSAS